MQLISVIYHRYVGYRSPCKVSVSNIGTDIIGVIDRYITDFPDVNTFLQRNLPKQSPGFKLNNWATSKGIMFVRRAIIGKIPTVDALAKQGLNMRAHICGLVMCCEMGWLKGWTADCLAGFVRGL
ncbi:hypothetical protein Hanom_Chr04g00381471 [Helianthus anomalus]